MKEKILLIKNRDRSHKILPVLQDHVVIQVNALKEVINIKHKELSLNFVLVDSFGRWALLGLFASLYLNIPLVFRLRGEFFREEKLRRTHRYKRLRWARYYIAVLIAKLTLWRARGIIYNSQYLYKKMYQDSGKCLGVVYNPFTQLESSSEAVEPVFFDGDFNILTVTNMGLMDKIEPVVEGVLAISHDNWENMNIHWYICGDGPLYEYFTKQIENADLADRVHLLGHVEKIHTYYKACDIYAHLTRMDSFPNATLEAMYYGKPVIINADSCGTLEQVKHLVNGYILSSTDNIQQAIDYYNNDRENMVTQGISGRKMVGEYFSVESQRHQFNLFVSELSSKGNCSYE